MPAAQTPPDAGTTPRLRRVLFAGALVASGGFLALTTRGHVDDGDAQLYLVVARHLAEDHAWLNTRYLPAVYPQFREHLPFGLWPSAVAIRLFGDGSVGILSLVIALATLALVAWMGKRLAGWEAGLVALLILGATASFFETGSRPRLDGPLVLLATAASAPVLFGGIRRSGWLAAVLLGAAATLVKGPFGLLPLGAAVAARATVERSARLFLFGTIAVLAAAVPAAAFLLLNHYVGDDTWWVGYFHNQLIASLMGRRTDGVEPWWFQLRTVGGRFWPGLPFAVLGLLRAGGVRVPGGQESGIDDAERVRAARLLALHGALLLVGLCLPSRKVWNHALVAYPALALLGGVGGSDLVAWLVQGKLRRRVFQASLIALCAGVWVAAVSGFGTRLLPPPCVAASDFRADLDALPRNASVLIVSRDPDWRLIASLAAERDLNPVPIADWSGDSDHASLALVQEGEAASAPPGWRETARSRGWVVFRR